MMPWTNLLKIPRKRLLKFKTRLQTVKMTKMKKRVKLIHTKSLEVISGKYQYFYPLIHFKVEKSELCFFFRLLDHLVHDVTDRKSLQSTYDWTKRYCEKCSFTNPDLFKPAFDLYLKLNGKYKQGSSMLKDVSIKIRAELGNFNDSITVS